MNDLKDIVDDGTTVVTIPTPEGWRCERPNCSTDFLHTHTTYSVLDKKYIFYRRNASSSHRTPPTRLSEREARILLAAAGRKNIDRLVEKLKAGDSIVTTFGTYTAELV